MTPRAGLAWPQVSLKAFTDAVGSGARVSVEDARSLAGSAGMSLDADAGGGLRLFGSVDVTHEFPEAMEASAVDFGVRLGLGGAYGRGEGGRYSTSPEPSGSAGARPGQTPVRGRYCPRDALEDQDVPEGDAGDRDHGQAVLSRGAIGA